jgi:phytoene dehydrogenase-like protein
MVLQRRSPLQAGRKVLVLDRRTIGGGMRTLELTLPGFHHDVCSSVHPLGLASPFFRTLPLEQYGLEWVFPSAELAHPLDDGTALMIRAFSPKQRQTILALIALLAASSDDAVGRAVRENSGRISRSLSPHVIRSLWRDSAFWLCNRQTVWRSGASASRGRRQSSPGWRRTQLCRWNIRQQQPSV